MSRLGDALRMAREKTGMTQNELAVRVGVRQQRIADIESGKVTSPRSWEGIADAVSIPREDFKRLIRESGEEAGKMRISRVARGNIPQSARDAVRAFVPPNARIGGRVPEVSARRLPVYGQAVGGDLGEYIFNGQAIDYVMCPAGLENVQDAYAVFVDGDSMAPRYRSGETVWVHPSKPPRRGDDVVVQIAHRNPGEPPHGYIKEFVGWTGSKLKLQQHNPVKEIAFDRNLVMSVHPIVFSQKA